MHNQLSKVDAVDLFTCQTTSQLYFDALSIFEYSKTDFSFQSESNARRIFNVYRIRNKVQLCLTKLSYSPAATSMLAVTAV